MTGPGMTSLSNKFCDRATDAAAPARSIPTVSICMRRRCNGRAPALEEMRREDVNDGGNHEQKKQR